MEETPVNAAHAYANAAEEYEEKEQWSKAMEAHFRAAEQFLLAMNYTSNPEAVRTLKLLYANHTRQGKELKRRLSKQSQSSPHQKQEQFSSSISGADGQQQQSSSSSSSRSKAQNSSSYQAQINNSNNNNQIDQSGRQNSSSSAHRLHKQQQRQMEKLQQTSRSNTSNYANRRIKDYQLESNSSSSTLGVPPRDNIASSMSPLNNSTVSSVEESYMVLRGNNDSADDDDADPFNKFWQIVESLVSKVSNPVAFATVPLNGTDTLSLTDPRLLSDSTAVDVSIPSENKLNGRTIIESKIDGAASTTMMESFFIIPDKKPRSSDTFHKPQQTLSTTTSGKKKAAPTINKTIEEYALENQQLKIIVDKLSKQMLDYEKAAEENSMLKSSIMQFKSDVEKQAKRIKHSQELRASVMVRQLSPESSTVSHSNYLQRRIKELEEELRLVKLDNEKQKASEAKYRERWEKLKESAKKKRSEKQAESLSGSPKSALTIVTNQEVNYSQERPLSPTTTYSRLSNSPQLSPSPTSRTPTPTLSLRRTMSQPVSLSKQRQGVSAVLDSPPQSSNGGGGAGGSVSKGNNNIGITAHERTPVPPTTTIVHATATGSPTRLTHARSNSISSNDFPFAISQPELKRPNSSGSLVPSHIHNADLEPIFSYRRDSAPTTYARRYSSTSISSINASGTNSAQSVYHNAPLAASDI
ncbi:12749_t:CDS:10 [Ambispora gerdemannii]|uniref:12749_t:CDS:1 n=1 Tax=Ambispora gerdemannii TaxID=144530 RepID=A0A9N9D9D1_9GLOM|nr:12749_t:CDS:10 [Ambispora gerdemannii]